MHVGRDPVTGRERQVSRTVRGGLRAARAARAELVSEVARTAFSVTRATVGGLLDEWNRHRERSGAAPRTTHEDQRKIDTVLRPALGAIPLGKLRTEDIDRFYSTELARGTTPATVRKYHAILHAALRTAQRWGRISANPANLATPPPAVHRRIEAPQAHVVRDLIRAAQASRSPHLANLIGMAALSAMRAGELCGLRFSDVDWEHNEVVVARSVWKVKGRSGVKDTKSHQVRRVALPEVAMDALRLRHDLWTQACREAAVDLADGYVWARDPLGLNPLMPSAVSGAFVKVRNRAGLSVRFHDLRHFAATEMLAAGAHPRVVSDQLGHAKIQTTLDLYVTSRDEGRHSAAAALGRALGSDVHATMPPDP